MRMTSLWEYLYIIEQSSFHEDSRYFTYYYTRLVKGLRRDGILDWSVHDDGIRKVKDCFLGMKKKKKKKK